MTNSALFATFASQVFAVLHESFPIPLALPKKQIIECIENHDEFWELQRMASNVTGFVEIMEISGKMTPTSRGRAEQKQRELSIQLKEKEQRLRRVELVFDGTVDFLVHEEFVRFTRDRSYQLTLKGFIHLNKRFGQEGITEGASLIEKLLNALRPENFSGSVTTGTLAALIAKVFGG